MAEGVYDFDNPDNFDVYNSTSEPTDEDLGKIFDGNE